MSLHKGILALLTLLFISCSATVNAAEDTGLTIIEQDYNQALTAAKKEGKLLFIDFYTTWCGPCKKLDKLVFRNDSVQGLLNEKIVLLRYDAENDTVFHLSKKHHVSSYPTGMILNENGYVVSRKRGFLGDDFKSLSSSVIEFINAGVELSKEGTIIKGYSNKINPALYPDFYVDYVNRTDTDLDSTELNTYLSAADDVFSEQYFATLLYFASDAHDGIADATLENQDKYSALYGKDNVELLTYFLARGKFKRAIVKKSQADYNQAVAFVKRGLSQEWIDDILPSFEKDYLIAQNRWDKVFAIYEKMKNAGEMSNGYVNHFSWQVYKSCDDQEVIKKCLTWMQEVTDAEPEFDYLDTYAYLLYKSGNNAAAKKIAQLAIKAGKADDRSTKGLEQLITKL